MGTCRFFKEPYICSQGLRCHPIQCVTCSECQIWWWMKEEDREGGEELGCHLQAQIRVTHSSDLCYLITAHTREVLFLVISFSPHLESFPPCSLSCIIIYNNFLFSVMCISSFLCKFSLKSSWNLYAKERVKVMSQSSSVITSGRPLKLTRSKKL